MKKQRKNSQKELIHTNSYNNKDPDRTSDETDNLEEEDSSNQQVLPTWMIENFLNFFRNLLKILRGE
jgi:hypothetical protein